MGNIRWTAAETLPLESPEMTQLDEETLEAGPTLETQYHDMGSIIYIYTYVLIYVSETIVINIVL